MMRATAFDGTTSLIFQRATPGYVSVTLEQFDEYDAEHDLLVVAGEYKLEDLERVTQYVRNIQAPENKPLIQAKRAWWRRKKAS